MSISSDDFEKSEREPNLVLLDFLRSNPRVAYGLDELVGVLASKGRKLAKEEVERMLDKLEYGQRVELKAVAGATYYRYRKFLGFNPPTRVR